MYRRTVVGNAEYNRSGVVNQMIGKLYRRQVLRICVAAAAISVAPLTSCSSDSSNAAVGSANESLTAHNGSSSDSTGEMSQQQIDMKEWEIQKSEYVDFLKLSQDDRIAFASQEYEGYVQQLWGKMNYVLPDSEQISSVPVLSETSSAQEITDFNTLCKAVATVSTHGEMAYSLCNDEESAGEQLDFIRKFNEEKPSEFIASTRKATGSTGYYEENGDTFIKINSAFKKDGSGAAQSTFKRVMFQSFYDGQEHLTYRLVSSVNPGDAEFVENLPALP